MSGDDLNRLSLINIRNAHLVIYSWLVATSGSVLFSRERLGAGLGSFEEEVAFAGVAGEGCGAFEFDAGFGVAI
jgi:hypothetical protein